ncbi:MAG: PIN domain-containing protein [Acidobacteria bacterium]|nr:PIN domain-containing protein [Acidobacteriota bacterium]MBV9434844.1 PIN domain-containing protein [Acidobacteriota bacterium]
MIAADTSTWIAFLEGNQGPDVEALDRALAERQVVMPPPVLTELLSDPKLPSDIVTLLIQIPLVELAVDFWEKAGRLRAKVLARNRKARLGDALIAQSCIHGAIPLLTRDRDFQAFTMAAGLKLLC